MVLPAHKMLLISSDGIQNEALIGFWDVRLCVTLLIGQVHLAHDGSVVLARLLHHLQINMSQLVMRFGWQLPFA